MGWFDVPVDDAVLVQVREGSRQRETDWHAIRDRQTAALFEIVTERVRRVQ